MIIVGIDPGTKTGYAEMWDGKLAYLFTFKIHEAMSRIRDQWESGILTAVYWEDARKRQWYGTKGREALQGAGSIKRDCSIWEDFFHAYGIPNHALPPQAGATKWSPERFAKVTGWTGRTSEHARDAAMLIWGRKV